ncbi:hypothetical protein FHW88_006083 [Mucilaginibacter sp. SG538B]|uniref:hypothetical protein n=1 Tax=Mucilaginibacter sp. SG538B TaxID=2587021 RepID=UPI00159E207A|nr:hypothetical protein [Mucilaginibacter sp. SG538B]NVM67754.1 hypothetical protein [Mucilaginibacter sp. SG538B]
MKTIVLSSFIVLGICSGFGFKTYTKRIEPANTIYGYWTEKDPVADSLKNFQIAFFPGGKISVTRKLHCYTGYFKIRDQQANYITGRITIGENYPFTATFLSPDKIKLAINYKDSLEVRYMKKTKAVKAGFQLIDAKDKPAI